MLRRSSWRRAADALDALASASRDGADRAEDARCLTGYVLEERRGMFGLICIFESDAPEAVRRIAYRSGLPIDEIALVVAAPDAVP